MTEERSTEEDVLIRTWKMELGGHRNKGRSKLRWSDVIRKCMKEKQRNKETDMINKTEAPVEGVTRKDLRMAL